MLEQAVSALTEQMQINNALFSRILAAKEDTADAKAEAPEAEVKPAEAKAERKPRTKKEEAPKTEAPKSGIPTEKDIHDTVKDFLGIDDQDERMKRREFIKAMLNELGGSRATEMPAEHRAKAIQWIKAKLAGEEVSFTSDEDEDALL